MNVRDDETHEREMMGGRCVNQANKWDKENGSGSLNDVWGSYVNGECGKGRCLFLLRGLVVFFNHL